MQNKFDELRRRYEEVAALGAAGALLGWDQNVFMPPGGAAARGKVQSVVSEVAHLKFTAPETGALITEVYDWAQAKGLESFEASFLRAVKRDYDHEVKIPAVLVKEFSLASTASFEAWHKAKQASDYSIFAPHLDKILELSRLKAEALGYAKSPYDALLDMYDPGLNREKLDKVFAELAAGLTPVIKAINERADRVSSEPFKGDFDLPAQLRLSEDILKAMGYDFSRGRLDQSAHPFSTGIVAPHDARITTWTQRDWLPASVYGSMHEGGHALYEQGFPAEFAFSPLASGASLGVHESQSRFWENLIGRSRPFAAWALPLYRKHFPGKFDKYSAEDLYRAANRSEASLIRVEADEVTYNLHVALRYEIETRLLDGGLKVKDAPEFWNAKMQEYLGVKPSKDSEGILQDVHWGFGMIGYFPSYTIGNLISAQLFAALRKDLPDLDARIEHGDFAPVLAWLRRTVHAKGRTLLPEDLLQEAIGERLSVAPFVDYIKTKYSGLYGF